MAAYQKKSAFLFFAQMGLFLIFMTAFGLILRPLVPDQWVKEIAVAIHSNFDTLADLSTVVLGVVAGIGLSSCLFSVLVHEQ